MLQINPASAIANEDARLHFDRYDPAMVALELEACVVGTYFEKVFADG